VAKGVFIATLLTTDFSMYHDRPFLCVFLLGRLYLLIVRFLVSSFIVPVLASQPQCVPAEFGWFEWFWYFLPMEQQ
jgi:hypothetical protein